jgi:Mg-chelatase subunit ChlD
VASSSGATQQGFFFFPDASDFTSEGWDLSNIQEDEISDWQAQIAEQSTSTGDDSTHKVEMNLVSAKHVVPRESVNELFAVLSLRVEGFGSRAHLPSDICLCLDVSGSMRHQKLENLIEASLFLLAELGGNDRVSIVSFNTRASLVSGWVRTNAQGKAALKRRLHSLRAGGGTSILSGMELSKGLFDRRRSHNPLQSFYLLTDGIDGAGLERKTALAAEMMSADISIAVFGFGADHDSDELTAIAGAGEGSFVFIESADAVADAFGGVLGAGQATVARDVRVSISPAELELHGDIGIRTCAYKQDGEQGLGQGSHIRTVFAGPYKVTSLANGTHEVLFRSMVSGERRDVLLSLALPACPHAHGINEGDLWPVLTAEGSLVSAASGETEQLPLCSLAVHRGDVADSRAPLDEEARRAQEQDAHLVDSQVNRMRTSEAVRTAISLCDRGQFPAALTLIEDSTRQLESSVSKDGPVTKDLLSDLNNARQRMNNPSDFHSGGKADMRSRCTKMQYQREWYCKDVSDSPAASKSIYQTTHSAARQAKFTSLRKGLK